MSNHFKMYNRGFTATIVVIMLASCIFAMSLTAMLAVINYSDSVSKKELRIQANMNADACMDTALLMLVKDYFLNGNILIPEFDCTINFSNSFNGNVFVEVKAILEGVNIRSTRSVHMNESSVTVM